LTGSIGRPTIAGPVRISCVAIWPRVREQTLIHDSFNALLCPAGCGARVILQIEEPLRQLMSGLASVSQCKSEALPDFDLHCPLLSLPLAFGTRLETIPSGASYLRVPAQARDWQVQLGSNPRPRIGMAWSGNPQHQRDA
jgi:hypothetical protein